MQILLRIALLSALATSACAQVVANGDDPLFHLNINQQNINNNKFPLRSPDPPKEDDLGPNNLSLDADQDSAYSEWDVIVDAVKSILAKESLDSTSESESIEDLFQDLSPEAKAQLMQLIRDEAAAAVDDEKVRERTIQRLHKAAKKRQHDKEPLTRVLYNWSTNSTIGIQLSCSGGTRGRDRSQHLLVPPGNASTFEIPCCRGGNTPSLTLWDQEAWTNLGTFSVSKDPPRVDAPDKLRMSAYEVHFNQPISGDIRVVPPKPPKEVCPRARPELGAPCRFQGKCSYGQETCCDGSVHPNMVVQCGPDGIAAGFYTDACMAVKCAPPKPACPLAVPELGSRCNFPGEQCSYGQETCCDGSVHPNFVVQCSEEGFAAGFYTDACMMVKCDGKDFSSPAPSIASSGDTKEPSSSTPSPTPQEDSLTASPTEFMPEEEECPVAMPELGSECGFEGNCYYGEETCCDGSVHPNMVVRCSEDGFAVGFHTDACMGIQCDAPATESPTEVSTMEDGSSTESPTNVSTIEDGSSTESPTEVSTMEDGSSTESPTEVSTMEDSVDPSSTAAPTLVTTSPNGSNDPEDCPVPMPQMGSECSFEGNCYYGEETCCDGKARPNMVVQCGPDGIVAGYYTDACYGVSCDFSVVEDPTEPDEATPNPDVFDFDSNTGDDVDSSTASPTLDATSEPTSGPSSLRGSNTASPTAYASMEDSFTDTDGGTITPSSGDSVFYHKFFTEHPTWSPTISPTFYPTWAPSESTVAPTDATTEQQPENEDYLEEELAVDNPL